jgi:hypothetical protein
LDLLHTLQTGLHVVVFCGLLNMKNKRSGLCMDGLVTHSGAHKTQEDTVLLSSPRLGLKLQAALLAGAVVTFPVYYTEKVRGNAVNTSWLSKGK